MVERSVTAIPDTRLRTAGVAVTRIGETNGALQSKSGGRFDHGAHLGTAVTEQGCNRHLMQHFHGCRPCVPNIFS